MEQVERVDVGAQGFIKNVDMGVIAAVSIAAGKSLRIGGVTLVALCPDGLPNGDPVANLDSKYTVQHLDLVAGVFDDE